jgi:glycosyltransferase involved in cell wall biosynthesis
VIVGIDAAGLRRGGGLVYLKNLLEFYEPARHPGIDKVIVWGIDDVLEQIETSAEKVPVKILKSFNPFLLFFWKLYVSFYLAPRKCDVLFVPAALFFRSKRKTIILLHNLLPFSDDKNKYKYSPFWLKMKMLEKLFMASYRNADGVIFPSRFMAEKTEALIKGRNKNTSVIYHSAGKSFFDFKGVQPRRGEGGELNLLCVSFISHYKGQFELLEDFREVIKKDYKLNLAFAGALPPRLEPRFTSLLTELNKIKKCVEYLGSFNYDEMPAVYEKYDALIFPSSCESFGYPIIEAAMLNKAIILKNKDLAEILDHYNYKNYYVYEKSIEEVIGKIVPGENSVSDMKKYTNSFDTFDFIYKTYSGHA